MEMTSLLKFSTIAASRGDGLHPKLRDLLERAAARPFSELAVRGNGMLQAGPDPVTDALAVSPFVDVETGTPLELIRGGHPARE
jgi:hypothetical protein